MKKPRYWHKIYKVAVEKSDIPNWNRGENIKYIGDFTDVEWKKFVEESERNAKDEPIIKGQKIDQRGNQIMKKEKIK